MRTSLDLRAYWALFCIKVALVTDPCCGSGGMFIQSAEFVAKKMGDISRINVYGQEKDAATYRLAKMNLALRGISHNLGETYDSSFTHDLHKGLYFEILSGKWIQTHDCEHGPKPHEIRHLAAAACFFFSPFWLLKLRRVATKHKAVLTGVHILTVISLSGTIVKGFQNKNSGAGM